MNKNLKRLFVTTAIITSLASTNNAHATGLVTQFWDVVHNLKNARNPFEKVEAVKEVKEHLQYRQEWINEPEDMTGSLLLNTSFI